jgi:oxygen-independent coproporphyrinogen-3 oxidase
LENWLGAGPSASGTIIDDTTPSADRRTQNPDVSAYVEANNAWRHRNAPTTWEKLDRATLLEETIMLGYRCIDGPDEALFCARFGRPPDVVMPRTIAAWRARGYYRHNSHALTPSGLLFLNRFILDCLEEIGQQK